MITGGVAPPKTGANENAGVAFTVIIVLEVFTTVNVHDPAPLDDAAAFIFVSANTVVTMPLPAATVFRTTII
jgi:hypothetical protein